MSNIKGIMADVQLSVALIHPGDNPDWVDRAGATGFWRVKRLRPGVLMRLLQLSSLAPPPDLQRFSIDRKPIDPLHNAPLLKEFSTHPMPPLGVRMAGDAVHYVLEGDAVGVGSLVDLVFADMTPSRYPARAAVSPEPATPGCAIASLPVKTLIVDVLVHDQVWPGVEPELRMYDTSGRGFAIPTDPARELDRVDELASIHDLGGRLDGFRMNEVGRYVEMIRYICDRLGWDATAFHGYRCRVDYPVYGTQMNMVLAPPAGA
jgi:hypothetical protein